MPRMVSLIARKIFEGSAVQDDLVGVLQLSTHSFAPLACKRTISMCSVCTVHVCSQLTILCAMCGFELMLGSQLFDETALSSLGAMPAGEANKCSVCCAVRGVGASCECWRLEQPCRVSMLSTAGLHRKPRASSLLLAASLEIHHLCKIHKQLPSHRRDASCKACLPLVHHRRVWSSRGGHATCSGFGTRRRRSVG